MPGKKLLSPGFKDQFEKEGLKPINKDTPQVTSG
jgi:hypothetical protein